jgi:hypothetical protein
MTKQITNKLCKGGCPEIVIFLGGFVIDREMDYKMRESVTKKFDHINEKVRSPITKLLSAHRKVMGFVMKVGGNVTDSGVGLMQVRS